MTEAEWELSKQLAETQMALAQAQAQVCQANFSDAQARLKALGDAWAPPETDAAKP
jgi:hypothetical protein